MTPVAVALFAFYALLTYLLGAAPFGLILVRRFAGVDVRLEGSGNIGATNVARSAGRGLGAATLALDLGKGLLPTLGAVLLLPEPWMALAVGFAAVIGHCWPVWLRFDGGKGVATSAGVLLVLAPLPALVTAGVWILVFAVFKKSSLASLVALVAIQVGLWWSSPELLNLSVPLALVLLVCHRANIVRLLRGTEEGV